MSKKETYRWIGAVIGGVIGLLVTVMLGVDEMVIAELNRGFVGIILGAVIGPILGVEILVAIFGAIGAEASKFDGAIFGGAIFGGAIFGAILGGAIFGGASLGAIFGAMASVTILISIVLIFVGIGLTGGSACGGMADHKEEERRADAKRRREEEAERRKKDEEEKQRRKDAKQKILDTIKEVT